MTEKKTEHIALRIESDVKASAQELAKAEGRTLSNYIVQLLKREIEANKQ